MRTNSKTENTEEIRVLNSDGIPTGVILSRSEIHRRGEWHQVVHLWIINDKNQVLIQKRSPHKRMYPGVKHASAAGHIEAGESIEEALIKETQEELGFNISEQSIKLIGRYQDQQDFPEENLCDREFINIYILQVESKQTDFVLQESEVGSVEWIDLDEFERQINDEKLLKDYLNHPQEYYLQVIDGIKKELK